MSPLTPQELAHIDRLRANVCFEHSEPHCWLCAETQPVDEMAKPLSRWVIAAIPAALGVWALFGWVMGVFS